MSKCWRGSKANCRRLAPAAHLDIAGLVLAVRHIVERDVGDGGQGRRRAAASISRSAASPEAMKSLMARHLGLERSARALSPAFIASPISLEAALRRACASCSFCTWSRRSASMLEQLRRHGRKPAAGQPPVECLRIVANGLDVVHDVNPFASPPIGRLEEPHGKMMRRLALRPPRAASAFLRRLSRKRTAWTETS